MPDVSAPPYDPSKLSAATLTSQQKEKIIAWLIVAKFSGISGIPNGDNLKKLSNTNLLIQYQLAYSIYGFLDTGIQSPVTAVKDAIPGWGTIEKMLEFLLDPVRMGEIIVGVIFVGVGINAMLKQSGAPTPSVGSMVNPINKAATLKRSVKALKGNPMTQGAK